MARLNDEFALSSKISYLCYGKEVGDSGTPHLQGYLELSAPHTLSSLKKFLGLPKEIHLEPRRGTQAQAIEYCKKDGLFCYWGTPKEDTLPKSKAKNKLLSFLPVIEKGGLKALSNHPDCTFALLKQAREYLVINEPSRDSSIDIHVTWYYGKTGTGKTRRALFEANAKYGDNVYIKSSGSKWFDGYDGEACVIFDDLRDSWFDYSFLLKLLDRYPHRVESKGGSRQFMATTIFITSPFSPCQMYKGLQDRDVDSIQQLLRRIHVTEQIVFPWKPPTPVVVTPEVQPPCPSVCTPLLESPLRIPRVLTPRPRNLYPVTIDSPRLFRLDTPLIPRLQTPPPSPTQPFQLFEAGPDDSTQCPPTQTSPCPDFVVGFW